MSMKESAKPVNAQEQWRRHGVDMSTPLFSPEINTNPTSFYRGRGRGVGPVKFRTSDPHYRLALAMSVHPTYFDLATLLLRK